MITVDDLRRGRARYATLAAGASAFVPITLVAWISWQVLEGDAETLLRSEFREWAVVASSAAALTCVFAAAFWRTRPVLIGAASGVILAGLAALCGLVSDIVASGGVA